MRPSIFIWVYDYTSVLNTNSSKVGHSHDERYYTETEINNLIGQAEYSNDLLNTQNGAGIVYYDSNTKNTPNKAGITQSSEGIGLISGAYNFWQVAVAIPRGSTAIYITATNNGASTGWHKISSEKV